MVLYSIAKNTYRHVRKWPLIGSACTAVKPLLKTALSRWQSPSPSAFPLSGYGFSSTMLNDTELFRKETSHIVNTNMDEFHIRFGHANYLIGKYIHPDIRKGRFLDIGCGTGNAVVAALSHGAELSIGIDLAFDVFENIFDINEFPAICAHYNVPVERALLIEADIFSTKFRYACFDYAMFIDSFEHVPEPYRFLECAMSVLKPGGYLLVATAPLYYSRCGHHLWGGVVPTGELEPWEHLFPEFDTKVTEMGINPWHLRWHLELNRITYSQILSLLRQCGFEIDFEESFSVPDKWREEYERVKHKIVLPMHVMEEDLFRESIIVRAKKPVP